MNLIDLNELMANAAWFSRIDQFKMSANAVPLASVASRDNWMWLPTSRDQADPIHGDSTCQLAEELGKETEHREAELNATLSTIKSLRTIDERHPTLVDGPHDFTPAAKSAAQYAARMAAREIVVEQCGFWCDVIQLYNQGYWPCGLTADGKLVVH